MNISFPGLGVEFSVDRVAFELFGISLYWYGIIIAIGLMAGMYTASVAAGKLGEKRDIVFDIVLACAPFAVICARLYYVLFSLEDYIDNPVEIINLRSGGLAIYGGIIGAVVSAFVYCRITHKNILRIFDIGGVGLITGQMIGRWGNFFNQEAFGNNTTLPWGMTGDKIKEYLVGLQEAGISVNPDMPVHPTFLYESLWSAMTLVCLFLIIYKFYKFPGQVFFAYGFLYGAGRFWIEGLRTDSLMLGSVRISQLVALTCVVVFGILYLYNLKKSSKNTEDI